MKPKNFPARKLARQLRAQGSTWPPEAHAQIDHARAIRSKKLRGTRK